MYLRILSVEDLISTSNKTSAVTKTKDMYCQLMSTSILRVTNIWDICSLIGDTNNQLSVLLISNLWNILNNFNSEVSNVNNPSNNISNTVKINSTTCNKNYDTTSIDLKSIFNNQLEQMIIEISKIPSLILSELLQLNGGGNSSNSNQHGVLNKNYDNTVDNDNDYIAEDDKGNSKKKLISIDLKPNMKVSTVNKELKKKSDDRLREIQVMIHVLYLLNASFTLHI